MDINETIRKMHGQKLYCCGENELIEEQLRYLDMVHEYNNMKPSMQKEKQEKLKEMFAHVGEDSYVETPFYASWGGKNVTLGNQVYTNYNLMLIDDTYITIGNHVMIGPNVVICSGTHPVSPRLRMDQVQYNLPVKIEDNVWIGASCVIMPGVTIGADSIIGAGSVVTKNIPANVIAYGNPCKVAREITQKDEEFYNGTCKIDI